MTDMTHAARSAVALADSLVCFAIMEMDDLATAGDHEKLDTLSICMLRVMNEMNAARNGEDGSEPTMVARSLEFLLAHAEFMSVSLATNMARLSCSFDLEGVACNLATAFTCRAQAVRHRLAGTVNRALSAEEFAESSVKTARGNVAAAKRTLKEG